MIGIGSLLLGIPIMLICAAKFRDFFSRPLEVAASGCARASGDHARRPTRVKPTVLPGTAPPWWLEDALGDDEAAPSLEGAATADVAIVGGGYTGLWTARTVREREPSARIVVLEAEICGAGPSGRNGGFVEGYWPAVAELRSLFGDEGAVRLATAGEPIRPAIRALGEDVWLRESGMLMVATTERQEPVLDRAVAAAAAIGRPEQAISLTHDEVAARCASPLFRRGVLFPDTGTVHPGRLVRALRRAALAHGVVVHERTRVSPTSRRASSRPNAARCTQTRSSSRRTPR